MSEQERKRIAELERELKAIEERARECVVKWPHPLPHLVHDLASGTFIKKAGDSDE